VDTQLIYVDGQWQPSASADTFEARNPATEEVVGLVPDGVAQDVDDAVRAAGAALPGWAALSMAERSRYLRLLRRDLLGKREEFAAAITAEMGAPITFSQRVQTGLPLRAMGGFLDALPLVAGGERLDHSLVLTEPVGVVAALTPWNYPLNQILVKVAAALAVGCTVVLKPSELAPLSASLFAQTLHDVGLPPGVFNLVVGRGAVVGSALVGHDGVDMVSFTGSTAVGRQVAALAAGSVKKVALELGGKSACVVLPDADFEAALADGVAGCLLNAGQTCTALTRLLVPRSRFAETVDRCARLMAEYRIGDPQHPDTRIGPLVSDAARQRVLGYLDAAEAAGIPRRDGSGGQALPERGYFVAPTVLAVEDPNATVAQDELFGPVLCVLPYDDENEALAIANNSRYGLAGAVWSGDVERATAFARRMCTGRVDINGARLNPAAPFGGRRQSGFGYELGRFGLAEFQVYKAIQLPEESAP
jgi:acyl-CoA reductase-like NAD-dependent aldehyde dehydrogenase